MAALLTFGDFVETERNRFARRAAMAVAEHPGEKFNPLTVVSRHAFGKSHLLEAILVGVGVAHPKLRGELVTAEEFTNAYVDAIQTGSVPAFRERFEESDVLLIDDIQVLALRRGTQQRLLSVLRTRVAEGRATVLATSVVPSETSGFDEALTGLLASGLTVEIAAPTEAERREIVASWVRRGDVGEVPDDVVEYIAGLKFPGLRHHRGALVRVTAFAELSGEPVDLDLAHRALAGLEEVPAPQAADTDDEDSVRFREPLDLGVNDAARRCTVLAQERARRAGRGVVDTADVALAVIVPFDGVLPVFARSGFPSKLEMACVTAIGSPGAFEGFLDTRCLAEVDRIARAEAARRRSLGVAPEHILLAVARIDGPGKELLLKCGIDYAALETAYGPIEEHWKLHDER